MGLHESPLLYFTSSSHPHPPYSCVGHLPWARLGMGGYRSWEKYQFVQLSPVRKMSVPVSTSFTIAVLTLSSGAIVGSASLPFFPFFEAKIYLALRYFPLFGEREKGKKGKGFSSREVFVALRCIGFSKYFFPYFFSFYHVCVILLCHALQKQITVVITANSSFACSSVFMMKQS